MNKTLLMILFICSFSMSGFGGVHDPEATVAADAMIADPHTTDPAHAGTIFGDLDPRKQTDLWNALSQEKRSQLWKTLSPEDQEAFSKLMAKDPKNLERFSHDITNDNPEGLSSLLSTLDSAIEKETEAKTKAELQRNRNDFVKNVGAKQAETVQISKIPSTVERLRAEQLARAQKGENPSVKPSINDAMLAALQKRANEKNLKLFRYPQMAAKSPLAPAANPEGHSKKVTEALIQSRAEKSVTPESIKESLRSGKEGRNEAGKRTFTYANGQTWTENGVVDGKTAWINEKTGERSVFSSSQGRYLYAEKGSDVFKDRSASQVAEVKKSVQEGLIEAAKPAAAVAVTIESAKPALAEGARKAQEALTTAATAVQAIGRGLFSGSGKTSTPSSGEKEKPAPRSEENPDNEFTLHVKDAMDGNFAPVLKDARNRGATGALSAAIAEERRLPENMSPERQKTLVKMQAAVELGDVSKMSGPELNSLRKNLDTIYLPGDSATSGLEQLRLVDNEITYRKRLIRSAAGMANTAYATGVTALETAERGLVARTLPISKLEEKQALAWNYRTPESRPAVGSLFSETTTAPSVDEFRSNPVYVVTQNDVGTVAGKNGWWPSRNEAITIVQNLRTGQHFYVGRQGRLIPVIRGAGGYQWTAD